VREKYCWLVADKPNESYFNCMMRSTCTYRCRCSIRRRPGMK
jgi:hypothetical protein